MIAARTCASLIFIAGCIAYGHPLRVATPQHYGKLPLQYAQTAPDSLYEAVGKGFVVSLKHSGVELNVGGIRVVLKWCSANRKPAVEPVGGQLGVQHRFEGKDPSKWKVGMPAFTGVRYRNLYPRIDFVAGGRQDEFEYDLVVAPGGDPRRIQIDFEGAREITVEDSGDLLLKTSAGELRHRKPLVYQERDGKRQKVSGAYLRLAGNRVGFRLGEYDHDFPLVIDPVVIFETSIDSIQAMAVDPAGNAYLARTFGVSEACDVGRFPTPCLHTVITKLNSAGTIQYSAAFRGSGQEGPSGIAADEMGNVYVIGTTTSTDFPTTLGAFQTTAGGRQDAFVMKLDPQGALLYSTLLGGQSEDDGNAIAIDNQGNAYVTGITRASGSPGSVDFPLTSGAFMTASDGFASFVAKLNTAATALEYSTLLSGAEATRIAVNATGEAFVGGIVGAPEIITSLDFPISAGAIQTEKGGGVDAFVTRVNATGTGLIYSTLLGGSGNDSLYGLALDSEGYAYVAGRTYSRDFPVVRNNAQRGALRGSADAFVSKLNHEGADLVFSTYLGGAADDGASALAVDNTGNVWIAGSTNSADFPITRGGFASCFSRVYAGAYVVPSFMTEMNASGSLVYSSFAGDFPPVGLAIDGFDNAYLAVLGGVKKLDLSSSPTMGVSPGCIGSAASFRPVLWVSPGDILSVFGSGLGPESGQGLRLNAEGRVSTTLDETQVLFDGVPAPLLYVQDKQINLVAPFEIGGKSSVQIEIVRKGERSTPMVITASELPVPEIFTLDASGSGHAAALNEDATLNSASNPAKPGSIISVWATGLGQTIPPLADGEIVELPLPKPHNQIAARACDMPTEVLYAGPAPSLVAGAMQVNLRVPFQPPPEGSCVLRLVVGAPGADLTQDGNISSGLVTIDVR